MIHKRFAANLRAQNWSAILVELGIVILAVFIGALVANANQQRLEGAEAGYRLKQLKPELQRIRARADITRRYYATTRRYAQTAFAAWAGNETVNDSDFVIAAYQASQIKGMVSTSQSWAAIVGVDQLRNIDDPAIREPMLRLMTFADANLGQERVQSGYRNEVRTIIPDDIEQRIRSRCGDYFPTPDALDLSLHEQCSLILDPKEAAATAAELRRHPELVGQLRLHLALVSSQLNDVRIYDTAAARLERALKR